VLHAEFETEQLRNATDTDTPPQIQECEQKEVDLLRSDGGAVNIVRLRVADSCLVM
jgi:hypothetical protein